MNFEVKLGLIQDPKVREALTLLYEELRRFPLIRGNFNFFEITFDGAVDDFVFYHRLGFKPLDIITTHVSNDAAVVWDYESFTKDKLIMTVSDACTVRAFIGRYEEGERV